MQEEQKKWAPLTGGKRLSSRSVATADAIPQKAAIRLKSDSISTCMLGRDPKEVRIAARKTLKESFYVSTSGSDGVLSS